MSPLSHLTLQFEGQPLTTVALNGVAGWPAFEIGLRLGYGKNGRRLVTAITGDWADEFIEGHDYVKISGRELAMLKTLLGESPDAVSPYTSEVVMLLEPGLDLVLVKTHKEIGRRLRRFLVDEILPRLRRGEAIGAKKPVPATIMLDLRQLRETRLWRQADLADRKFRSGEVARAGRWLHAMGRIDADALVHFEVLATRIALSCAPTGMLPNTPVSIDMAFVLAELERVAA